MPNGPDRLPPQASEIAVNRVFQWSGPGGRWDVQATVTAIDTSEGTVIHMSHSTPDELKTDNNNGTR